MASDDVSVIYLRGRLQVRILRFEDVESISWTAYRAQIPVESNLIDMSENKRCADWDNRLAVVVVSGKDWSHLGWVKGLPWLRHCKLIADDLPKMTKRRRKTEQ